MAQITAALVKELRERTGAGMMDCKKALTAVEGDMDKAIDFLREKGLAAAAKKAGRIAAEGVVGSFVSADGKIGVIVELKGGNAELGKDVAMHVAAANPSYLERSQVPAAELEHEKEVLSEQAKNEGKPEKIIEKMVMGRINKYYKEVCLVDQEFVKDPDQTVGKLVKAAGAEVLAFSRFQLGEGIEKKQEDFAAEVMSQIK